MKPPSIWPCPVCDGDSVPALMKRGHAYYRCKSCKTLLMVPPPSDTEIENHYRSKFISGNYELLRRFSTQYRKVYEGFLDTVQRAFGLDGISLSGLSLFEVGCFTGDFLELAVQAGCKVRGLELQDEAVTIAEQRIPGCVTKGDVNDDEWSHAQYDAVCLFGIVEHVRDPRQLIRRSAQLLRPRGYMFIQTPDSASLLARLMRVYWPPISPIEHINLMSRHSLRRCLNLAGLEVVETRAHVKSLPVEYVFENMRQFGPELRTLIAPIYGLLPNRLRAASLPFYGGEMLVTARKIGGSDVT